MNRDEAQHLLERIAVVRHPCDLDLLIFFVRHPRSLLASEHLVAYMGYEIQQISASLDVLIGAGLLTRAQNPTHAARLYVFAANDSQRGWLPSLIRLASTREGRLELREALRQSPEDSSGSVVPLARDRMAKTG